ncbi:TetR/AcrR family transcriptional regulator [Limosilactobacillus pontis]|uniref:TetR/AcrR family transcriptional regulator n=1 Tax=Limosilactobacillus pontis TaxID=35787 RepID=UPI0022472604|nr:TetR/AcrR family transcriptional regulator [Limosilactobacillus pontis]MCX2186712.1 TetR/AcrR family transcriptional regulator [Limosilactobacillus pontis]MCX2188442.1 TetR/AcrR family transcriptional regulator [Limosilactobacillus pontis]
MAVNKTDPRVIKTRNSLRKALVYLMRRDKIENISVQKITETANLTRGTFYLHYRDKQDFIESAMKDILDDFFAQVMVDSENFGLSKERTVQVISLQKAFQYIENNADIFDVLLNDENNNGFYERFYNRLANYLTTYGNVITDNQKQLEVPLNLQISFIGSAFLGLISHWLEDGMIYTSRYMTQSTAKMFNRLNNDGASLVGFFSGERDSVVEEI